jgi:aquaporin rerated protein, other eukaryote
MNIDRPAQKIRLPWKNRKAQLPSDGQTHVSRRVPLAHVLPLKVKNHLVAMLSEFAGTFLFLLFALGGTNVVNAAPKDAQPADLAANPAKILFISLCFGMSLAVNAWVFFRISGGLFNPAVCDLFHYVDRLLTSLGVACHDGGWRCRLPAWLSGHYCSDPGRHRCFRCH